jgi:hypothetical protein
MKKLLIFVAFLCLGYEVLAKEKIERSFEVSKNPYIQIEHINGSARVIAWDKLEVKVTGTLGEKTERFIFEKDDNEVTIKVKVKVKVNSNWSNLSSYKGDDLEIFVPRQSKVYYSAVSANVELV